MLVVVIGPTVASALRAVLLHGGHDTILAGTPDNSGLARLPPRNKLKNAKNGHPTDSGSSVRMCRSPARAKTLAAVDAFVRAGGLVGVAEPERDRQAGLACLPLGDREHRRGEVDRGDLVAAFGEQQRQEPGAGPDIEYSPMSDRVEQSGGRNANVQPAGKSTGRPERGS